MPQTNRRRAQRTDVRLLVSYRAEDTTPTPAGYVNSINLSEQGMLLESPDSFHMGSDLIFEILLDYDHAANVHGRVVRIEAAPRGMNRVAIEFQDITVQTKELLRAQSLA
jgi:hypothetical protein